ncbi:MAG TPA: NADH-quinone oxidoreductase subunit L [Burkholderiales bacterium]|nr:NADH-quinone oxidoreductase subunit L [Burkholderiales bacterium]
MKALYLIVPLAPLAGALVAGLLGRVIGRRASHVVTIAGMVVSVAAALLVFRDVVAGETFNGVLYTWAEAGGMPLHVGFLIDRLSATMMVVVTFVSLMVHVYTIGYMADDPGYQRFFSYISLFTFSMLMLVMSNNFLQLFFGWEAVGLVSYLLIGFWYTRPTAIYANLKAFMVNRVGDLGFLLGIALVYAYFGTLDYAPVFEKARSLAGETIAAVAFVDWPLITTVCILLFIGAMGKSAQFPLHVWLPDSMEGPTPISALIHAATMVTAGIFMVARMSHLFELSEAALSFIMVIGGITALFMALVAIVQNDIKRVVAYSTLSQLGYMTVALGASAYAAGMFHLVTHAFFKALLFLGAGSVIIAMHHEQDMRRMGGLRRYMPLTYATMMVGAIASVGIPGFSGFFSKDAIIEAVELSHLPGSGFAYFCVAACVFVTAFYTFRLMFMTFHGAERFGGHDDRGHGVDAHDDHHGHDDHGHAPHESPAVVTGPLLVLAIPSVCAGWWIGSVLYGGYFGDSIHVEEAHDVIAEMAREFHGVVPMTLHALATLPFWLSMAGIAAAAFLYLKRTDLPAKIARAFGPVTTLLENKYYFDRFNDWFFAGGARALGRGLWKVGDVAIIDGALVNGSARVVGWLATVMRKLQSGLIYHYAFTMIIGVFVLLTIWFARS